MRGSPAFREMATRPWRRPGVYWGFTAGVVAAGLAAGLLTGWWTPLIIGTVLVGVGPIRSRWRLFWPVVTAAVGFVVSSSLTAPWSCPWSWYGLSPRSTRTGPTLFVCHNAVGTHFVGSFPTQPAVTTGIITTLAAALAAWAAATVVNRRAAAGARQPAHRGPAAAVAAVVVFTVAAVLLLKGPSQPIVGPASTTTPTPTTSPTAGPQTLGALLAGARWVTSGPDGIHTDGGAPVWKTTPVVGETGIARDGEGGVAFIDAAGLEWFPAEATSPHLVAAELGNPLVEVIAGPGGPVARLGYANPRYVDLATGATVPAPTDGRVQPDGAWVAANGYTARITGPDFTVDAEGQIQTITQPAHLTVTDGTNGFDITIGTQTDPFAEIRDFDGRHLVVSRRPEEPAAPQETFFVIDLACSTCTKTFQAASTDVTLTGPDVTWTGPIQTPDLTTTTVTPTTEANDAGSVPAVPGEEFPGQTALPVWVFVGGVVYDLSDVPARKIRDTGRPGFPYAGPPVATRDGLVVATGEGYDATLTRYPTGGGDPVELARGVGSFALSADGSKLAWAEPPTSPGGTTRLVESAYPSGRILHTATFGGFPSPDVVEPSGFADVVTYVGDNVLLMTGDGAGATAAVWTPAGGRVTPATGYGTSTTGTAHEGRVVLSRGDGTCGVIVTVGADGSVTPPDGGTVGNTLDCWAGTAATFSPDGSVVASAGTDGETGPPILLLTSAAGEEVARVRVDGVPDHHFDPHTIAWLNDRTLILLAASYDDDRTDYWDEVWGIYRCDTGLLTCRLTQPIAFHPTDFGQVDLVAGR